MTDDLIERLEYRKTLITGYKQTEDVSRNPDGPEAAARIRELEAALERIGHMKPHHAGQTANEYHMQQIAKEALAGRGGE